MNTSAKEQVVWARNVVERRRAIVEDLGTEPAVGYAIENYRSLLMGLKECKRHLANALSAIDDKNADIALDAHASLELVSEWVTLAEDNLRNNWGQDDSSIKKVREGIMSL